MAVKYTKSKRADADIKKMVQDSMAEFGEIQTNHYMHGFESTLNLLAETPNIGMQFVHPRTQKSYLRHPYVSHMVYYRKRADDIYIVRVLHKRMLPQNHIV